MVHFCTDKLQPVATDNTITRSRDPEFHGTNLFSPLPQQQKTTRLVNQLISMQIFNGPINELNTHKTAL